MGSEILWTLSDGETDWKTFERLCIDLLYRNGFPRIRPTGGPQDAGRDAESSGHWGKDKEDRPTFFQFSLREDWDNKLEEDLGTVDQSDHEIYHFVFVTPRPVAETTKDRLAVETKTDYGWLLTIFDREWLRFQLEEANPDLTERHLDIVTSQREARFIPSRQFNRPPDPDADKAWQLFRAQDYERAAAELTDYIRVNPHSHRSLAALAQCQYLGRRYTQALNSINRALELSESDQYRNIRGCILAEYGREEDIERSLREAEAIFRHQVNKSGTWVDFYNLANALSSLEDFSEAAEYYQQALKQNDSDPRIWKNLASCYHQLGDHDREFECFNRALSLNPQHIPTLVSKGISSLLDRNEPKQCVALIERSLITDSEFPTRWPHVWYWLAKALHEDGDSRKALAKLDDGLRYCPGDEYLIELRAAIAVESAAEDPELRDAAKEALRVQLGSDPTDYRAIYHLGRLEQVSGNEDQAWKIILSQFSLQHGTQPTDTPFNLDDFITATKYTPSYHNFRHHCPLAKIHEQTAGEVDPREFPELIEFIWLTEFVAYSQCYESFIRTVDCQVSETGDLMTWLDKVDTRLEEAMLSIAARAGQFARSAESTGQRIERTSRLVLAVVGFAALEFERISRWIPAERGADESSLETTLASFRDQRRSDHHHESLIDELLESASLDELADGSE